MWGPFRLRKFPICCCYHEAQQKQYSYICFMFSNLCFVLVFFFNDLPFTQRVLGSIPVLHFFLIIIVKGKKRSSTIALHAVMCVFGICSQDDLEDTRRVCRGTCSHYFPYLLLCIRDSTYVPRQAL